jgi:hypothetical protein
MPFILEHSPGRWRSLGTLVCNQSRLASRSSVYFEAVGRMTFLLRDLGIFSPVLALAPAGERAGSG